ncbi:NTP transferase domain-containing protein [Protofrankia sp. BMG5.30]|uniref:NTP transferase domain-containing protein n=1 Tax=Protofrankia sp. BMG5.30 TaxID=1834514 RepID=UPI0009786646|nr:NTP transferase domain-containing protein [Protofrankia sp. BMG5.30]ONH36495.1 hypothetical protein BL254_06960 [Protofrankia sp. BMG5.30]
MNGRRTGWDAVVLAGGLARRLGGVDKPALTIGEKTLLERVLTAVDDAQEVIVVGPRRPVAASRHVVWTRERPPGGGPVAALAAGLELVGAPLVAVLAADLPFVTAGTLDTLVRAVDDGKVQGALLADPAGRRQYLTGVWRTSALRARLPVVTAGVPMRSVLAGLPVRVLPADARVTLDCDRPADVERARCWVRSAGSGAPGQDGRVSSLDDWVVDAAGALDLDPALLDVQGVLKLAREVAHAVERPAAPLTAFLVGLAAGRAGGDPRAVRLATDRVLALVAARAGSDAQDAQRRIQDA